MIKIKYKNISESSLNFFAKMIYSDILDFYKNDLKNNCKKIKNSNDTQNSKGDNLKK